MAIIHTLPMDQAKIKQYLPHRDPFLFVDRVTGFTHDSITIESDVKSDAPVFKGHFPSMPILPGVLIVETVAQAGALLTALRGDLASGKFMGFSAVDSAKFKKPVYPNETMRVDVEIVKIRGPFYKFSGRVEVNSKLVAIVQFSAAQMDFDLG